MAGTRGHYRALVIVAMVMRHAQAQLLRERTRLAMPDWESKDAKLPAIETLIGSSG